MDNWCTFTDISGCVLLPESVQVHTACGFGYSRGGSGQKVVEKDITPNDWISSTERRIIGMPTVTAAFYAITGSMQTAVGIACVLLGAILLGNLLFFSEKIVFQQAGIFHCPASTVRVAG